MPTISAQSASVARSTEQRRWEPAHNTVQWSLRPTYNRSEHYLCPTPNAASDAGAMFRSSPPSSSTGRLPQTALSSAQDALLPPIGRRTTVRSGPKARTRRSSAISIRTTTTAARTATTRSGRRRCSAAAAPQTSHPGGCSPTATASPGSSLGSWSSPPARPSPGYPGYGSRRAVRHPTSAATGRPRLLPGFDGRGFRRHRRRLHLTSRLPPRRSTNVTNVTLKLLSIM
jgi:hypothetical protein